MPRAYQPWTAADEDRLRQLHPTHTAQQVAHLMGRTVKSIRQQLTQLGLRKYPHWPPEVLEQVRSLHAEGLHDSDIARRMGLGRLQVKHLRKVRLRLPVNHEAVRQALRQAVRSQQITLGIRSGGELRQLAYRNFARRHGWPEDLRPREVQILNVLAARGVPMSRSELCAALGVSAATRWASGSRRIPLCSNSPGGTYTASLARRGLLVRLVRAGPMTGQGKGRSVDLYTLSTAALAILAQRALIQEQEQCQNPTDDETTV